MPIYVSLAVLVAELFSRVVSDRVSIVFVLCYFVMHMGITVVFFLLGREKWDIVASAVITPLLMLLFRDRVLTWNLLVSLGIILIIYILRTFELVRVKYLILSALLLIGVVLYNPLEISLVSAIALAILIFFSVGYLLRNEAVYFISVFLIMGIAAFFLPVKDEPLSWEFAYRIVEKVEETFDTTMDEMEYMGSLFGSRGVGFTGYSDKSSIGGGLKKNSKEELAIDSDYTKGMVYLKGRSSANMSAQGFDGKVDESRKTWFAEYINALYNAGVDKKKAACFSKVRKMSVEYKYLRTEDMIAPENVLTIDSISDFSEGRHGKGYRFSLHYMALDTASPYLIEVMEQENVSYADYEVLEDYTWEVYHLRLSAVISRQEYESIAAGEKDFAPYLDASMATDRVRQLAQDITKDAETDYDKAKAIEAYLRTYEYNTSVDYSKSENYIDEFLFEKKSGYCIYYASSMILLMRSCGIPARYSVGFAHKLSSRKENVLGNEAHGWAEGYIEGFGWVRFEPTPVMNTTEDMGWGLTLPEDEEEEVETEKEKPNYEPNIPDMVPDDTVIEQTPVSQKRNSSFNRILARKIGYYVAAMLTFVIVVLLLIRLVLFVRYMMLSPNDKLAYNVSHIRKTIDDRLLKGAKTYSIYDYAFAVPDEELSDKLKGLFDDYYKVRFRGEDATDELVDSSRKLAIYLQSRKFRSLLHKTPLGDS